ncbi:site-2 protease family protein [Algoriphagus aestuariicola]|uniref:Site-2 protease family protein n=1 Tax=Algoriphagus aestuariicola TaxID=1852016 RepID=A0ABS3BQ26_9BACT|nr:site-2 protease family protein [Algoriphagus aestuariicola]MBN7801170.1 site-2 protease family protein [Algoriphagus aestuariicola]
MYKPKEYVIHGLLLLLTLVTTTLAGGEWVYSKSVMAKGDSFLTGEYFLKSMAFSVPFIGILLVHELGHLLTSLHHKVKCSLPYFIPAWFGFIGGPSIGTFGAIIRMKGFVNSRRKFFDIGVAGPIAGFILAIGVLWYGFVTLPPADYIYSVHPEYADPEFEGYGEDAINFELGNNLLFWGMGELLAEPDRLPAMSEVIHFPVLFAGYLALFFTALNLLPIGQLDGGHVVFGLFPRHHRQISIVVFTLFLAYAGLGTIRPEMAVEDLLIRIPLYVGFLYICYSRTDFSTQTKLSIALSLAAAQYLFAFVRPEWDGYQGWLLFAFLLGRVMGLKHPEVSGLRQLDWKRKCIGWLAILIFALCFSPRPFIFS